MKKLFEDGMVILFGAASSLITAGLVCSVYWSTGFNFFTLSFWVVVPIGALLTGFAAASGYYLGAKLFNHKPDLIILLNMVIVAGTTQFLIYYFQYSTMILDDGTKVKNYLDFPTYLKIVLTKAKYGLVRHSGSGVEAGYFGYVIAFIQFIAFLVGGVCVWGWLYLIPFCDACNKYFKSIFSKIILFSDKDTFTPFYEELISVPSLSPKYFLLLKRQDEDVKNSQGCCFRLKVKLFQCPNCKGEKILESVDIYKNDGWDEISDLVRETPITTIEGSILGLLK